MSYKELHRRSIEEPEAFWGELAAMIGWHRPFDRATPTRRLPNGPRASRLLDDPAAIEEIAAGGGGARKRAAVIGNRGRDFNSGLLP